MLRLPLPGRIHQPPVARTAITSTYQPRRNTQVHTSNVQHTNILGDTGKGKRRGFVARKRAADSSVALLNHSKAKDGL